MIYYFACTRGHKRMTFASTRGRFNPRLEQLGSQESDTPQNAYNAWAKRKGVNYKCVLSTQLGHTLNPVWQLELEEIK